jgi:hypothetical protein
MARVGELEDGRLFFECPGCGQVHAVKIAEAPGAEGWDWNGDEDAPTIVPGIRAHWHDATGEVRRCECTIEAGWIRYSPDSNHPLAGASVELPEVVDSGSGHTLH